MTIHHIETTRLIPPSFAAVTTAVRQVIERCQAACSSHSAGAGATRASAVALTAPMVSTTSPNSPTSRQRVRTVARTVSPTSQPRPIQGSSITEVRDTYGST
jgi:cytoskeletal protein RodZ